MWIHLDVPYHRLLIDGKCYLKPPNFSQQAPQIGQWSYSNPSGMLLYKTLFPKHEQKDLKNALTYFGKNGFDLAL